MLEPILRSHSPLPNLNLHSLYFKPALGRIIGWLSIVFSANPVNPFLEARAASYYAKWCQAFDARFHWCFLKADTYVVKNPYLSVLQATELLHLIMNEHDDQSSLWWNTQIILPPLTQPVDTRQQCSYMGAWARQATVPFI